MDEAKIKGEAERIVSDAMLEGFEDYGSAEEEALQSRPYVERIVELVRRERQEAVGEYADRLTAAGHRV